jgi:hypothetical protein
MMMLTFIRRSLEKLEEAMITAILIVVTVLLAASEILYFLALGRKQRAVSGSYQRLIYSRQAALAAAAMMIFAIILGIVCMAIGDRPLAILLFALAAGCVLTIKAHLDEDDWFSRQRRRFKQRLKNIRRRLAPTATPLPSPT